MNQLASITIFTSNRQSSSVEINTILSEYSHLIMSRMGVNVQRSCTENCPGMIVLAVQGDSDKIKELLLKLKKIEETKAEILVFDEE
jgi:metal-responsive CopG/Arc/MetJ family transcriptional regulator